MVYEMAIRLMVSDDRLLVREGIKSILKKENDIRIVGEAYNGETAIKMARSLQPDVMLLKLRLDRINAFGVLRKVCFFCKVVILTDNDDEKYLLELAKLGAGGYFGNKMAEDGLARTIRQVDENMLAFPVHILAELEQKPETEKNNDKKTVLTPREMDILNLVGMGMGNAEISDKLIVSEKTVKNHLTNIFKKINVNDRTQAFVYAVKNKLVLLDLEN